MFVSEFRYSVVEHDPSRPWIVVGETRHLVVDLESAGEFSEWAGRHWPRDRYTVQLEPGQEQPRLRY